MSVILAPPITPERGVSTDGWPPEEDRPLIRRLRLEVRQVLGQYVTYLMGRQPRLLPYLGS